MKAHDVIRLSIESGKQISMGYLSDLTDAEMMKRPCPGCNHITWQVGHLIAGEQQMIEQIAPGTMPKLPEGFAAKYTTETSKSDKASDFHTKAELMALFETIRGGTLAALAKTTEADLDKPTGVEYAPTVGAMFELQGAHWLMHAGQWVVVRRQCGRPAMF